MNPDILAVPRGRRWVLRPLSLAGGMFLSEGGEQRRDGSLVVTLSDYDFLVRRCRLGWKSPLPTNAIRGSGVNLPSKGSHDEPWQVRQSLDYEGQTKKAWSQVNLNASVHRAGFGSRVRRRGWISAASSSTAAQATVVETIS